MNCRLLLGERGIVGEEEQQRNQKSIRTSLTTPSLAKREDDPVGIPTLDIGIAQYLANDKEQHGESALPSIGGMNRTKPITISRNITMTRTRRIMENFELWRVQSYERGNVTDPIFSLYYLFTLDYNLLDHSTALLSYYSHGCAWL
jgi:hypothetical protein